MTNTYLSFITDKHLLTCIDELYTVYEKANNKLNLSKFNSNKVDVFKLLFDKKFSNLTDDELIELETQRQIGRTTINAIGEFHERILSGISGYVKLAAGVDIKSTNDKIFIELKNKYHTVKGEDMKSIFTKLENIVNTNKDSKAYFARILDTKSNNKKWEFSSKGTKYKNDDVMVISGDQLYKLVTGIDNALFLLYKALPKAIDDFLATKTIVSRSVKSSVLKELQGRITTSNRSITDELTFSNFNYYLGFSKL